MTEHNIFCFSKNYNDKDSFQQARYRAFNLEVGEKRYNEINTRVREILDNLKEMRLEEFWKQVTPNQWRQLLSIPEAKDFREGFEYISGQKIDVTEDIDIVVEGKTVTISRKSAIALGLLKK